MRLLSKRPDHGCRRAAQGQAQTDRWRYRGGDVEHMPLRHLHANPGGNQAGVGGAVMLNIKNLSRRGFLKTSGAAGMALVLGTKVDLVGKAWAAAPATLSPNVFVSNQGRHRHAR